MEYIYYASHGTGETRRVSIKGCDLNGECSCGVVFEDGFHPVAYVAKGAHGNYSEEGEYVRIYGFANDITGKGTKLTRSLSHSSHSK